MFMAFLRPEISMIKNSKKISLRNLANYLLNIREDAHKKRGFLSCRTTQKTPRNLVVHIFLSLIVSFNEKSFFCLVAKWVYSPPPPLRVPTTKKNTFFMCVFPNTLLWPQTVLKVILSEQLFVLLLLAPFGTSSQMLKLKNQKSVTHHWKNSKMDP